MTKTGLLLASILLSVVSEAAQAATMTLTQIVSFSTTRGVSNQDNGSFFSDPLTDSDLVSINRFDPLLGSLSSVELIVSGNANLNAAAGFRDDDAFQRTAGTMRTENLGLKYTFQGFSEIQNLLANPNISCSDTGNIFDPFPSCSRSLQIVDAPISGYRSSSDASLLSHYVGPGTLSVVFNQVGQLITREVDGDDGYVNFRNGNFRTAGTLQVNYHYSVVPIPAAAWLFGSALLGLIGWQRRKTAA